MANRHEVLYDDDEEISLISFGAKVSEDGDAEVVTEVGAAMYDVVEAAQRLSVSRNQANFMLGRMEVVSVCTDRKMTPEKVFNVPKVYKWVSGEPEEIIRDLAEHRVRARVQAGMGVGKSTRLAPLLAEALGLRVLVVALNAHGINQVARYIRASGIGRIRRDWSKVKSARVCAMTYGDFNSHMMTERRVDVFRCFDVLLFDEAFEGTADVFCAKRAFAAFATPECSLLLCSATISADVELGAAAAEAVGGFRILPKGMSVKDMIASGKLVSDYLVDRSYVVVPSDADVALLVDHYTAYGVPALVLDSASTANDLFVVNGELKGDSVTPRVLVMHYSWALGFNLELEYGIVVPERGFVGLKDGVWQDLCEPMTEEYVAQAKSRTGRGIGESSGGLVVGSERTPSCELHDFDKMRAFVILQAMYIVPGRTGRWDVCYAAIPDGLPPPVAALLLKVNLPVEVTLKFVADDGLIARKYARAVTLFTQMDHYILPSSHDEPKAIREWVVDDWVDPELSIESRRLVPVHAYGELQYVLHGISAIAAGEMELKRWRPEVIPLGSGYDSDPEESARVAPKLRRVESKPLPRAPSIDEPVDAGFRLDGPLELPGGRRVARLMDKDRMREALLALEATLVTGEVKSSPSVAVETEAGTVVEVDMVGDVNSPGGTLVCQLPAATCETMNEGRVLPPEAFLDLLVRVKCVTHGFVGSRVFDGYAGPWESYLRSLLDPMVLQGVTTKGEWTTAYDIVGRLRSRFDFELVNVLAQSNVTKSFVERVFGRQLKASKLVAEVMAGRFRRFGQSEGFFERVRLLKGLLDRTLVVAEQAGLYLPQMVSHAQRSMAMGMEPVVGAGPGRWQPMPIAYSAVPRTVPRLEAFDGAAWQRAYSNTEKDSLSRVVVSTQRERLRARLDGTHR